MFFCVFFLKGAWINLIKQMQITCVRVQRIVSQYLMNHHHHTQRCCNAIATCIFNRHVMQTSSIYIRNTSLFYKLQMAGLYVVVYILQRVLHDYREAKIPKKYPSDIRIEIVPSKNRLNMAVCVQAISSICIILHVHGSFLINYLEYSLYPLYS